MFIYEGVLINLFKGYREGGVVQNNEHPGDILVNLDGGLVRCVTFDQCRYGLWYPNGQPMKKRTRLMANIKHVVFEFSHKDFRLLP